MTQPSTSEYIPKRPENACLHTKTCLARRKAVFLTTKTTWAQGNPSVAYSLNGTLFSDKNEWSTSHSVDEPQTHTNTNNNWKTTAWKATCWMIQSVRKVQQSKRKTSRDGKVTSGLGVGMRRTASMLQGSCRKCPTITLSGERTAQLTY